jgi:two-component system sensor histidine kinase PilS (NtrC family)
MAYQVTLTRKTGLVILHPLVVTFILLSSNPIMDTIPTPFWYIIVCSFILAIIFLLLSTWLGDTAFYYVLFLTDIPLIGIMVHYSGGLDSLFPLLYALLIIMASLYLFRRGAYIMSLVSLVFLLLLILFENRAGIYSMTDVLYRFYFFGLLFLFTGFLSGVLSERYQKRTEEAQRLRLTTEEIIKNLPSGIITIDQEGEIVYTNIPDGKLKSEVHLRIARFLHDRNTPGSLELKIGRRYFVLTCARIADTRAGLGVLQDYTDIKKLEERSRISQQMKRLAELGGSLAHEIRNPLATIRGSLEVITASIKKKDAVPFVHMAIKESNRLNEIVTDFLNFAQFTPARKNRLHMSEVVNEALISVMERIHEKKLRISRKDHDFEILGDINKLNACLVNILINACEVNPVGAGISIETHANKRTGYVEICDEGRGVKKRDIKNIFTPFFTTKKGGVGLGLSIAKNIVEAHGGRIRLKRGPRRGTCVRIILPVA